jgi:hypothetical protein
MSRRMVAVVALALTGVLVVAQPAAACGGLVGENGTISLVRTTTLAAYTDGVERYVTAFEFTGEGEQVGSIVPLPDVPTEVVRGGDWTLQRLSQEVTPPPEVPDGVAFAVEESAGAEVLLETQIDALDITVLRGGGDEVGQWAADNGFLLTPDAPEVLDYYASRSPVFMAARFDAARARELGQGVGDSTPIMATIPTDQPWVPVRILALGLDSSQTVEADVFVLTDDEPQFATGGGGMAIERSEPASEPLLNNLRSDVGMEWVPQDMWLSYLTVNAPAGELDYDLAVSTTPDAAPSPVDAGIEHPEALRLPGGVPVWPIAGSIAGLAFVAVLIRRRTASGQAAA